jgi:hypothetical protein
LFSSTAALTFLPWPYGLVLAFAITAAWSGEKELALQQLEAGLRAPDASLMLSYGALKLLPYWDPLRGNPRFEKIVQSLAPKDATSLPR